MIERIINIFIPILPILYDILMDKFRLYEQLFEIGDINKPSGYQIQKINALYFISYINISILIFISQLLTVNAGDIKYLIALFLMAILLFSSTLATSFSKNEKFTDQKFRLKIRFYAIIILGFLGIILETLRIKNI